MAHADTVKQERMHIRLDTLSKRKLERAAAYTHKSLSEFVLGQALHAAELIAPDKRAQGDFVRFALQEERAQITATSAGDFGCRP